MENEVQPIVPIDQPPAQTPFPIQSISKTNWLKIFLLAALGLLLLAGSVYAGIQIGKNQTPTQQNTEILPTTTPAQTAINPTVSPTNEPATLVSPTPEETVAWKTDSIQMKTVRTEFGGPTNWELSYDIPTVWTLETKSRESDSCGSFEFTSSDKLLTLNMTIVCGSWSANYTPWPDGALIIGTQYNQGNDGHTTYKLRYFDSSRNQYLYTDADANPGTLDKSKTPINNAVLVGYKNGEYDSFFQVGIISLTYKGTEVQKNGYLEKADRIVNSLILK